MVENDMITNLKIPSTKDPEGDAKAPSSMPRDQQGQNPNKKKQDDPAGQQGGTEKHGRG
jgi:hypothetical protein